MMTEFDMTDLGLMRYFLGIEVVQGAAGNFLYQKKYMLEIFDKFEMKGCNSVGTPSSQDLMLTQTCGGKKDQVVLGWLLSSLSETTLVQVVGLSASRDVWLALENQYASCSRARLMQIHRDLQTMLKGNMTMDDYLQRAKQYADSLAASGQPMAESNIQQVILNGLDTAYDAIVTSLTTTLADTPMEDFQAHLLAFESRIQSQNLVDQVTSLANIATKSSQGQGRGNSSNRGRNSNNRGRGLSNPRSRPQPHTGPCQICGRKNHTAGSC
ncbi:hypothetical protein MRB53_032711 [Persea americana]|uniref:Uncharacterized protein n=1 Tax=Persea americana TaxID=3435 RepID=A0ACC2KSP0_PERAE|nr:hypothetical protein MRB53_032711 [Persea americana]